MKELKVEILKEYIEEGDAFTEKKAYDVYWIDNDGNLLLLDNDRDLVWVSYQYCKGAF